MMEVGPLLLNVWMVTPLRNAAPVDDEEPDLINRPGERTMPMTRK